MFWRLPLAATSVQNWPPEVWGVIIAALIAGSATVAVAIINRRTTTSNEKDVTAAETVAKLTAELASARSEVRWLRKQVEKRP